MPAKKKRGYKPRESKLIMEWLDKTHPTRLQWTNVRLGKPHGGKDSKYYKSCQRRCDIVFKDGTTINIVEAKMKPKPDGMGQLLLYRELFHETPQFTEFYDLPLRMIFLTTFEDPVVKKMCHELGFDYIVYGPPWAMQYLEELAMKRP